MKNKRQNIVSTSPNHSPGLGAPSAKQSIDAYIEQVFRKPSSATSSSSSSSSHAFKWELPPPLSSSISASSSCSSSPKTTSSTPSSSSSSSEWEFEYSECKGDDSCDDLSTEKWFNHRLHKKKTPRYVVTGQRDGFSAKPRAFSAFLMASSYFLTVTFLQNSSNSYPAGRKLHAITHVSPFSLFLPDFEDSIRSHNKVKIRF